MLTEYIVIDGDTYPLATDADVSAACRALSEAKQNSADVWRSPHTLDWIREHGDPDGVRTGHVVLADTNVSPEENGS